ENSRMNPPKFCSVLLPFLVASTLGWSQACPKVTLTSSTQQTIQGLVFAVNCLIDVSEQARSNLPQNPKPGLLAEGVSIHDAQHTRPYPIIVFAVIAVSAVRTMKMSIFTQEHPESTYSWAPSD